MSKRRTHAVAEPRETRTEAAKETEAAETPRSTESESPSRGPAQSPFKMATLLWGIPILLFIVIAVLKECVGVSIW